MAHCTGNTSLEPDAEASLEQLEWEALGRIVHSMRRYRHDAELDISRWRHDYARLKESHRDLLPHFPAKLREAEQGVFHNYLFLQSMVVHMLGPEAEEDFLPGALQAAGEHAARVGNYTAPQDVTKVRYVFKNLMRDWSQEGAEEREASYGCVVREVVLRLRGTTQGGPMPRVLVPGAGLGRLCLDLCAQGFDVLGNEFSYYMLITSAYILNYSARPKQWTIHPWLHSGCNHHSSADQLRGLSIPDVVPEEMAALGHMGMVAGDFLEVFGRPQYAGTFDAVATCFFIDTAHNILDYLETILAILKARGYWVNLGPLLYHWSEDHEGPDDPNIELSLEEVESVALQLGFVLESKAIVAAPFTSNRRGMFKTTYDCVFWTMRRRPGVPLA